jgi:folate-dependent tRNA-U54 methylase TrmFO/GidA
MATRQLYFHPAKLPLYFCSLINQSTIMDFSRFNQAEQAQINTMIEQKQVKLIKN